MARTKVQEAARRQRLLWGAEELYKGLQSYDDELGPWNKLTDKEREVYIGLAEATVGAFNGR